MTADFLFGVVIGALLTSSAITLHAVFSMRRARKLQERADRLNAARVRTGIHWNAWDSNHNADHNH